jgi:ADP-ribosylglycohydrolase
MIDRFQASLLGYAIGDALAAPIEDVHRDASTGEEPISQYIRAFPSHPVSHLKPGQYSDETQIMLILAKSLVECGGFDVDNLSHKLVDWFHAQKKRSEWRFPGNTLMKSCRKLAAGAPWNQSGHLSAGIIASCRTVPYGLAFYRQEALLKIALERSCRLTHTDQRTIGIAHAISAVIRMGLEGHEFNVDAIINKIMESSQRYIPDLQKRMRILKSSLKLDSVAAMEAIGSSGFCLEAFPAALYWFFRARGRFDELIIGAANSGGDADAVAAMAGAMFGAWFGLAAIPEKWLEKLEDVQVIKQLGCDIFRMAVPQA